MPSDEEIGAQLERELGLMKAYMTKFLEERESHTHWPVLDAVARMVQTALASVAADILIHGDSDPTQLEDAQVSFVEQVFWAGFKFGKNAEGLTECPMRESDDHAETIFFDPRMN
jgi:hypothetical protein